MTRNLIVTLQGLPCGTAADFACWRYSGGKS